MEVKQLNFNRPLLSVRRGSSTTAPPEVNKRKTNNISHPSLPPLPYYKSDLNSGPIRNPGVVPFQWEHTPGKPKEENKEQGETLEQLPLAPKLPPGRVANPKQKSADKVWNDTPVSSSRIQAENNIPCSSETSSVDKVVPELEGSEDKAEEDIGSSSEDENVTFVDARDTLSRTESFFLNCSLSGVSGVDGSNMEPSGAFSDPQTRDFMMGRFLPAAKAVASEAPQYASRKHPVAREQPKPVKKVVTWTKRAPRCYDVPKILPHDINGEGEEGDEEDDMDEFDDTGNMSAKFCGLLPKFCLLNPIPGMRDHAPVISSVRSVRTRPVYAGVCRKNENKDKTENHRGELKRITCQPGSTNKSSLNDNFRHNGSTAPCKNGSPQSFLGRDRGSLGLAEEPRDFRNGKIDPHRKGYTKFKELLADPSAEEVSSLINPAIEKTLYIDTEQRVESRNSNSSSSQSRGRNPSVDSLQDIKSLGGADENSISQLKCSESSDLTVLSSSLKYSVKSTQNVGEKTMKERKDLVVTPLVEIQQPAKPDVNQKSSPPMGLAPLLLKSPSESWLSRTLPSISSKHSSSKSYLGNLAFQPSPVDPRRDGMLKTSEGQHMIFRLPGELAPIMES